MSTAQYGSSNILQAFLVQTVKRPLSSLVQSLQPSFQTAQRAFRVFGVKRQGA